MTPTNDLSLPDMVRDCLRDNADDTPAAELLRKLVAAGLDRLPMPGQGNTLLRWRMLAAVAAHDLATVKLYEGHTDALAILAELDAGVPPPSSLWGVWCAEAPGARLMIEGSPAPGAAVRLVGLKTWCSGAAAVTHGMVSAWDSTGKAWLVAVNMMQNGIDIAQRGWEAVGMADTGTAEVCFASARATCVGASGAYLTRPGFWHGGAGIAACWYGAAAELAHVLQSAGGEPDAHRLAHLGSVDCALSAVRALLRTTACAIDAHPELDAMALAMRARLAVEDAAGTVMRHASEALGAGPFCRDRHFARLMADLPVFLRQSHARRDQATLGRQTYQQQYGWEL
jgi:hypothetical protein